MFNNSKTLNTKLFFFVPLIILTTLSYSFINQTDNSKSDQILGIYLTPNKRSKIEFVKREDLYYGKLIWNVNPQIKDKFNSDESLRSSNLIGQDIFKSFKYYKYERSWIGKFYDTESGITYDCKLWLENNNKNLMARGYIETPLIGRTETLKRVN